MHSFRTPEYEEGKEGHLEQKTAKEDSDALFLIQRSHFLATSAGLSASGGAGRFLHLLMSFAPPTFSDFIIL